MTGPATPNAAPRHRRPRRLRLEERVDDGRQSGDSASSGTSARRRDRVAARRTRRARSASWCRRRRLRESSSGDSNSSTCACSASISGESSHWRQGPSDQRAVDLTTQVSCGDELTSAAFCSILNAIGCPSCPSSRRSTRFAARPSSSPASCGRSAARKRAPSSSAWAAAPKKR